MAQGCKTHFRSFNNQESAEGGTCKMGRAVLLIAFLQLSSSGASAEEESRRPRLMRTEQPVNVHRPASRIPSMLSSLIELASDAEPETAVFSSLVELASEQEPDAPEAAEKADEPEVAEKPDVERKKDIAEAAVKSANALNKAAVEKDSELKALEDQVKVAPKCDPGSGDPCKDVTKIAKKLEKEDKQVEKSTDDADAEAKATDAEAKDLTKAAKNAKDDSNSETAKASEKLEEVEKQEKQEADDAEAEKAKERTEKKLGEAAAKKMAANMEKAMDKIGNIVTAKAEEKKKEDKEQKAQEKSDEKEQKDDEKSERQEEQK